MVSLPASRHDMREAAKDRLRTFLRSIGLELTRYRGTLTDHRQRLLQRMHVCTLYDVGANVGQYAFAVRHGGFRGTIHSVEPNPAAAARLQQRAAADSRWHVHECAIGAKPCTTMLNISANSVSSSLLGMEARHFESYPESAYVKQTPVNLRTLSDLVEDTSAETDMLAVKLDVQGLEGEVLLGAESILSKVVLLEIEVSLAPLYIGQSSAWQLLQLANDAGFRIVDLDRVCWDHRNGDLLQANILFKRTVST